MAAGYQLKGNIVCYQLTKYFKILTSRFSAISLWLNSCHMGMCWHDCARIHPNIDNSRNAIYPICRGWMAAGYQMKGNIVFYLLTKHFLACSRACASKVFSLRADCGRVIVYPGLKQWERPRHNIFGVCTRLAGGVCMSTSAISSASKHLTVTKIVWKIVSVTFDYLISHFFKILSLEFMANLFRDFRASVSLKVFHYRLRGKWCQYDLEIN